MTYGAAVQWCETAADALATQGVVVEVIDLRTVQPWDEAVVFESVSRTHRLLIVHEAVVAFGPGAEIAARVAEVCFDALKAPIRRIGAQFMPVPFARVLEEQYRPSVAQIIETALSITRGKCSNV